MCVSVIMLADVSPSLITKKVSILRRSSSAETASSNRRRLSADSRYSTKADDVDDGGGDDGGVGVGGVSNSLLTTVVEKQFSKTHLKHWFHHWQSKQYLNLENMQVPHHK